MTADESSTIELREVLWTARGGERPSSEVQDLSVRIAPRAITWLEGAPGEGKEAAFRFLSLAEIPETGEVLLEGNSHRGWNSEERARLRAQRFGFLTASPFLLPS